MEPFTRAPIHIRVVHTESPFKPIRAVDEVDADAEESVAVEEGVAVELLLLSLPVPRPRP